MMAAAQPFISGAISKTVNLPENATVDDITEAYMQSWKLGIKAVAIYRDGSKKSQPLMASGGVTHKTEASAAPAVVKEEEPTFGPPKAVRKRLPDERLSVTHKFSVAGHDGYITVGLYEDGQPGEIFIRMAKEGSTVSGLMDSFATAISIALQHGVPLETYVQKFTNMRFEPAGLTDDPDIRMAQSILDYIFRRLALDYLPFETRSALGIHTAEERTRQLETGSYAPTETDDDDELDFESLAQSAPVTKAAEAEGPEAKPAPLTVHSSTELLESITGSSADAPLCMNCGTKMRPAGSCFVCEGCGSTSGCS
jgi:ribonucleoside-diphosphate reductase alpha chain